jgi:hypothetical protein
MRLQVGVLHARMGEFARFRTSRHTIGTLEWGEPVVSPELQVVTL